MKPKVSEPHIFRIAKRVISQVNVTGHAPEAAFIEQMAQANRRNRAAAAAPG